MRRFQQLAVVLTVVSCGDKVEEFAKTRSYVIAQMKEKKCAFCCERGELQDHTPFLCLALPENELKFKLMEVSMCAARGDVNCIADLRTLQQGEDPFGDLITSKFGLSPREYGEIGDLMMGLCKGEDDEEACRAACGGEITFCHMPPEEEEEEVPECSEEAEELQERVNNLEWSELNSDLLISADEVRRKVAGFSGLGASDALKQPTLIAYDNTVPPLAQDLSSPMPMIWWQPWTWGSRARRFGQLSSRQGVQEILQEHADWQEARAKLIWQMALGQLAQELAGMIDPKLVEVPESVADEVLSKASTLVSVLKPGAVGDVTSARAALGSASRDALQHIGAFKGRQATHATALGRLSGLFSALALGIAAWEDFSEHERKQEFIRSIPFVIVLDMVVETLAVHGKSQLILNEVLKVWQEIPGVMAGQADEAYGMAMLKNAIKGIVMVKGSAVAAAIVSAGGGGSTLVVATVAIVLGTTVEVGFNLLLEPAEYLRSYQIASLIYTASSLITGSDPKETLVRAGAVQVANDLMDSHVVGKVFPHLLNPQEWPIMSELFKDAGLAVEVPAEAERKWRNYLDEYYGRFRFDLYVTTWVVWEGNKKGRLSSWIDALLNCILKPKET